MASIARIWDAFSSSCKNVKSHESAVSGNSLTPKIKAQLHSTPSHLVHNTLVLVERGITGSFLSMLHFFSHFKNA